MSRKPEDLPTIGFERPLGDGADRKFAIGTAEVAAADAGTNSSTVPNNTPYIDDARISAFQPIACGPKAGGATGVLSCAVNGRFLDRVTDGRVSR